MLCFTRWPASTWQSSPARGLSRLICRREARKLLLIEEWSWRVKTGRQRRRFCTAAGKGPFLPTFRCRLIPERQAEQFLWRASRFCCDGGNLQVTIKPRLSNIVKNTQFRPSLRSLIKSDEIAFGRHKKSSFCVSLILWLCILLLLFLPISQKLSSAYFSEMALCITLALSSSVSPPSCFIITKQTR